MVREKVWVDREMKNEERRKRLLNRFRLRERMCRETRMRIEVKEELNNFFGLKEKMKVFQRFQF